MSWNCYIRRGEEGTPRPISLAEWVAACRQFPDLEVNPSTGTAFHESSNAVLFFDQNGVSVEPEDAESACRLLARLALVLGARFEHD